MPLASSNLFLVFVVVVVATVAVCFVRFHCFWFTFAIFFLPQFTQKSNFEHVAAIRGCRRRRRCKTKRCFDMSSRLCSLLSAPVVVTREGVASGWHGQLLPLAVPLPLPLLLIAC